MTLLNRFLKSPFLLLALSFLLFNSELSASHQKGFEISYECMGGCTVRVKLSGYRSCAGIANLLVWNAVQFNPIDPNCTALTQLSSATPIQMTELTPVCASVLTDCASSGAPISGYDYHVSYRDYSYCSAPANCNYQLTFSSCCRNGAITSLTSASSMGNFLSGPVLNTSNPTCNTPPQFNAFSSLYFCAGQTFELAMGGYDVDGDSLAYALGPCFGTNTNQVTYNLGYNPSQPMGASWDVSLDPLTGNLTVTPQPGLVAVGVVCIYIEEWRNGILVNTNMRDIQLAVVNCPSNTTPVFNPYQNISGGIPLGPNTFGVCPGNTVSFDIPTNDPDANQIQELNWDGGIAGAVFSEAGNPTVLDTIFGVNPTGHFEFTPTSAGVYSFEMRLKDDMCPLYGIASRRITIVASPLQYARADLISCTSAIFSAQGCGGTAPYTYQWSGQGGLSSTSQLLTHTYATPGVYAWECIITDANSVADTIRDTLSTSSGLAGPLINNPDTMFRCPTQAITLIGAAGFSTYLWSTGANSQFITVSQDGVFTLTATDSAGCVYMDSVLILPAPPSNQTIIGNTVDTLQPCMGIDSSYLYAVVPASNYLWSTGSTSGSLLVNQPGTYSLIATDNVGCQLFDTVEIALEGVDLYGVLSTSSASPMTDQKVYLIIYNSTAGTLTAVDSVQSNSSGFYSFCGINTIATYFVKAAPDSSDYPTEMPTYADSSLVWNNASPFYPASLGPIEVNFSTLFGANPGGPGFIGGLVSQGANKTDGPGDPVFGLRVFLYDVASQELRGYVDTDSSGYFSFPNLPYGDYKVIPDKPNVDASNVPLVSIDQSNPMSDSLDFRLHETYLELVFPTSISSPISDFSFQIAPNPMLEKGRIKLELEESGPVLIEVYDMRGMRQEVVANEEMAQGSHLLEWKPELPPGAYFLRLKTNSKENILKVILLN